MKDNSGYTPWKGRSVKGWPTTVLLRGEVLVADGKLNAKPGAANSCRARRGSGGTARPATRGIRSEAEFRREAALSTVAPRTIGVMLGHSA